MINAFAHILLALVLIQSNLATTSNYRRSGEFHPVKVTYNDMFTLLSRMQKIIPPPETQDDKGYVMNSLTFSDGELQVEINLTDEFQIKEVGRLPPVSFDFEYSFYSPRSKIAKINIQFSDYKRKVYVEGTDPDKVDAMYSYLVSEIKKHTKWIGGSLFRAEGGSLLVAIGFLLFFFPEFLRLLPRDIRPNISFRCSVFLDFFGLLVIVTTFGLPYDEWLPGFAVYSESSSALVRHSAQISFLGVLLGIVSIILACIFFFRSQIRMNQTEENKSRERKDKICEQTDPRMKQ